MLAIALSARSGLGQQDHGLTVRFGWNNPQMGAPRTDDRRTVSIAPGSFVAFDYAGTKWGMLQPHAASEVFLPHELHLSRPNAYCEFACGAYTTHATAIQWGGDLAMTPDNRLSFYVAAGERVRVTYENPFAGCSGFNFFIPECPQENPYGGVDLEPVGRFALGCRPAVGDARIGLDAAVFLYRIGRRARQNDLALSAGVAF